MKTPAEVRTTAARRFRASCRRWLAGHLGLPDDSAWPFAVPLGVPSEREVLADPQKTLDWRDAWSAEAESGRLKVAFAVRDWTACGRQTVPERAVFESPEAVARAAGELHTWRRALERASRLVDGEDGLREALVRAWSVLAEWEDERISRFCSPPSGGLPTIPKAVSMFVSCPSRAWIPSGSRSPE